MNFCQFSEYGGPEIINTKVDEMKSDVLTLEFVNMNESPSGQGIKRKVMKEMDVQKLVGMAKRVFKVSGTVPTLSFVQSNVSKIDTIFQIQIFNFANYFKKQIFNFLNINKPVAVLMYRLHSLIECLDYCFSFIFTTFKWNLEMIYYGWNSKH